MFTIYAEYRSPFLLKNEENLIMEERDIEIETTFERKVTKQKQEGSNEEDTFSFSTKSIKGNNKEWILLERDRL